MTLRVSRMVQTLLTSSAALQQIITKSIVAKLLVSAGELENIGKMDLSEETTKSVQVL